jgi:putative acetyltransferase
MDSIRIEPPRQADVLELLAASDAYMAELYPAESNHLLDVSQLEAGNVAFYVARAEGRALGCGAWVRTGATEAELKRMFVAPAARGMKVGRRLLARIETEAAAAGVRILRLETGVRQPEALALYRNAGYVERPPFGVYGPDPLSIFMEKRLEA